MTKIFIGKEDEVVQEVKEFIAANEGMSINSEYVYDVGLFNVFIRLDYFTKDFMNKSEKCGVASD